MPIGKHGDMRITTWLAIGFAIMIQPVLANGGGGLPKTS
jgi:hypothetical protein